jgi:GNAT superfamily N-acetyltransferase
LELNFYGSSIVNLTLFSISTRSLDGRRVCFWSSIADNQHKMNDGGDFQIRAARVQDVAIVLELIRDLATYERAPQEVVATEQQLRDVLFGKRPAAEVLLAFEGDSPVGFALFFHNFSTWLGRPGLYLEDLFVKPEKRAKGYGRALLVELAKIARDRGCGRMEWAVLNWNEPAIKFYHALGAKPMDEWTVFRLTRDGIEKLADEEQSSRSKSTSTSKKASTSKTKIKR